VSGRVPALVAAVFALAAPAAAAQTPLPGGRAIVVNAGLTPSTHLFGDSIVATVDVVVDPVEFDPERLHVRIRFAPYEPVGGVATTRRDVGRLVHLHYVATLRCLHIGCLAPRIESILGEQEEGRGERHAIVLPPVAVTHEEGGRQTPLLARQFPVAQVVSRLSPANAQGLDPDARPGSEGAFSASLAPPARTYRVRPAVLAGVALAAAVLLALFPAVLVGAALRRRWLARRLRGPLSPLERALALVEWSADHGDVEDRRKALEALAAVLEEDGVEPVAQVTRELAWAEPTPAGHETGDAGTEARRVLAGGDGRVP
jgi:hypothetical protein